MRGVTVEYRRGQNSIGEPTALTGKTTAEITDDYGVVIQSVMDDFLIAAADLGVEPSSGDTIRFARGGKVYVHEVMSPGGNRPASEPSSTPNVLRIHTKYVAVEG